MSLITKAEQHKRDFEKFLQETELTPSSSSSTAPKTAKRKSPAKSTTPKRRKLTTSKQKEPHPDEHLFKDLFEYVVISSYKDSIKRAEKEISSKNSNNNDGASTGKKIPKVTQTMKDSHRKISEDIRTLIHCLNDYSREISDEKMIHNLDNVMDFLSEIRNFRSYESTNVTSQNIPCFITQEYSGKGNTMKLKFSTFDPKTKEKRKIKRLVSKQWCSFIESYCFLMKTVGSISAYARSNIGAFKEKESAFKIQPYLNSSERTKNEKKIFNGVRRSFIFFRDFFGKSIQAKKLTESTSSIWYQLEPSKK